MTTPFKFKSTTSHGNADGLSRLPLPSTLPDLDSQCLTTFNIAQVQALPVTFGDIQKATRRDAILSKVYRYIQEDGLPRYQKNFNPTNSMRINLVLRMAV